MSGKTAIRSQNLNHPPSRSPSADMYDIQREEHIVAALKTHCYTMTSAQTPSRSLSSLSSLKTRRPERTIGIDASGHATSYRTVLELDRMPADDRMDRAQPGLRYYVPEVSCFTYVPSSRASSLIFRNPVRGRSAPIAGGWRGGTYVIAILPANRLGGGTVARSPKIDCSL